MKKALLLGLSIVLFGNITIQAQSFVNGGNSLSANGRFGTNTNHSLIFETSNLERARLTNAGLWGIGTTAPVAKLHVNSLTGQEPFRVQINGVTKLFVHRGGGVSVGTFNGAPDNGLLVNGLVGIGTAAPNSRVHINAIAGENPLRVMANGATKLFVHRDGGVAIGVNSVPPANGLLVEGNVGIGTTTTSNYFKFLLVGPDTYGGGISSTARNVGLLGVANDTEGWGVGVAGRGTLFGVEASGDVTGVQAWGDAVGVNGESSDGYGGYFSSNSGTGLYASSVEGEYAAKFGGDTFTSGIAYQSSDKNLKKEIQDMDNAMSIISSLKPKNYQFRDDGKYAFLHLPKGTHYGLLAQDVEEVLPNLVKDTKHEIRDPKTIAKKLDANGKPVLPVRKNETKESINIKAVNYTELTTILIKAMQEQQQTIQALQQNKQEQDAKIAELTQLVNKISQNNGNPIKPTDTYLGYSSPNPNSATARISYKLPSGSAKAQLVITNAAGQKLKQIQLDNSGSGDVDTTFLSTGTYFYSLFIDDTLIATEKMMVAR